MDTFRQRLLDNLTTTRTQLRRIAGINGNDFPTGPFCLVGGHAYQFSPRSVGDALVQAAPVAILHVLDVQVFKHNDLIFVYQLAAQLMRKVAPPIDDAPVNMLHHPLPLAILRCAPIAFREAALCFSQCLFILAKEAGVVDPCAVAESSKMPTAQVNAHYLVCGLKGLRLKLHHEAGPPVAKGVTLDVQPLDFTLDGAVQLELHVANFGQVESAAIQEAETALRKSERLIPTPSLESRIPWFLSALAATKEVLKGQVNTHASILQNLRMCLFEPGVFIFPFGQSFNRVIQRKRLFSLFPGFFAYLKGLVIDPSASVQDTPHLGALGLTRIESVFQRFRCHVSIIPFCADMSTT